MVAWAAGAIAAGGTYDGRRHSGPKVVLSGFGRTKNGMRPFRARASSSLGNFSKAENAHDQDPKSIPSASNAKSKVRRSSAVGPMVDSNTPTITINGDQSLSAA